MGSGKKNIELVGRVDKPSKSIHWPITSDMHLGMLATKWLRTVVEPTDW